MSNDPIDELTMSPAEAAKCRAEFVEELRGWFAEQFTRKPKYRSAMLLVSQYYADNASDAVHGDILWSVLETPDPQGFYAAQRYYVEQWRLMVDDDEFDRRLLGKDPNDPDRTWFEPGFVGCPPWYDNCTVALFAAFCPEAATSNDELATSCNPYAIFRRESHGRVTVEVIGRMLRPWVDGLPGSWMDGERISYSDLHDRIRERTPPLLPPADGRTRAIDAVREQVIAGFQREPTLRSALLLFHDSDDWSFRVTGSLLWSVLPKPDLDGYLAADAAYWNGENCEDPNRPGEPPLLEWVLGTHINPRVEGVAYFRAFCAAPAPTEERPNYAPYAIFRRGPKGPGCVEVEVVGTMLRPELDGTVPRTRR